MTAAPHWLPAPAKPGSPKIVVTFDTASMPVSDDRSDVVRLRCWSARIRDRRATAHAAPVTVDVDGRTPAELADQVQAAAAVTGEAWVLAHNAGYDLTVTSLPMILEYRGWEPRFVQLGDETCVFVFHRDGRKLVVTDSWSWLRCGMSAAAHDVGMRRASRPSHDDGDEMWARRCAHNVRILDAAVVELLDWWDREGVGRFAATGPSCGWQTLKRHTPPRTVLVGTEQPRTLLERSALYGGRREVWRVGRIRGRRVDDWDIRAAHLTTIAHMPLPTVPLRAERIMPPPSPILPPPGLGALCTVQITTRVPCAPVKIGDDAWWPVGTFRTVLTSPELGWVATVADEVKIIDAQWYRLGDALQPWGRWCEDLAYPADPAASSVVARVARGWGRSVPGRFALRVSELVRERPATHAGWGIETGHDLRTGAALDIITFGGVERTYAKDQDGADISPVVLAFIEGHVRAAVGRVIASRDPAGVLQVNTDGWWELRPARASPVGEPAAGGPYRLVRKATVTDVTLHGPNHLDAAGDRRLSGIPAQASAQGGGSFAWADQPGLRWQLANSLPGQYTTPGREVQLAEHYCRAWVLTTGETVPVSVTVDPAGGTVLLPWSHASHRRAGDQLAEWQVPALRDLAAVDDAAWQGPVPGLPHVPGRLQPAPS